VNQITHGDGLYVQTFKSVAAKQVGERPIGMIDQILLWTMIAIMGASIVMGTYWLTDGKLSSPTVKITLAVSWTLAFAALLFMWTKRS